MKEVICAIYSYLESKSTVNNKRRYYEQPRIVEQCYNYLQRMRRNRLENRHVVYLDETWCNDHHGKEKAWVKKNEVTGGTLGGIK